uniref:Uncharacterized protein n=1 Tax=Siphoviridae sp. ctzEO1 TaxID=2827979 RepID=A0A8S5TEA0_9CAUD|nr:MAG TPA: hypothetical protein [Siphoviridae sp. ctzEO1]
MSIYLSRMRLKIILLLVIVLSTIQNWTLQLLVL